MVSESKIINIGCLVLCSITQLAFFAYECVQIVAYGRKYFEQSLNIMELFHHILFLCYLILRCQIIDKTLMPPGEDVGVAI